MLCPRCNSENELGEKFCRHCGAPLVDTELFMSAKEKKQRQKEIKKQEKLQKKQQQKKYSINVSKKTYTLDEKAYRRDPLRIVGSLVKSLIILIILIVLIYFGGGFVLAKITESTDTYSVSGTKVPSINYVVGDRTVKKVNFKFKNGFKTEYQYINIDNKVDDLSKYISYLLTNNKFQLENEFNPNLDNGSTTLSVNPTTMNSDKIIVEINWTNNAYSLTLYKQKNT